MNGLEHPSIDWLRTHHTTISSEALTRFGISIDQRKRMVASGVLRRVVDGGYTFGGVDDAESLRCAALCSSRPHLVVSGPTAGRLWDLRRAPRDGLVHVVAPPHSQPCRSHGFGRTARHCSPRTRSFSGPTAFA